MPLAVERWAAYLPCWGEWGHHRCMPLLPRDLPARLAGDGYTGTLPEDQSGVLQVRVLSAPKVRRYRPGPDEVLIAVRSPGAAAMPPLPDWHDVLEIVFDDTGQYATPRPESQMLSMNAARIILAFVARHRCRRRLVLHCDAGVSRSRSLAAVISELEALPYRWTVVNPDVVMVVRAAATASGRAVLNRLAIHEP